MGGALRGAAGGQSTIIGAIGARKAAKETQKYQDKAMHAQEQGYSTAQGLMSPYQEAGQSALAGLQGIAGQPIDRNALLTQYFQSPEYQQLANQARYQSLSAAEATGGLGSTATSNQLASIAPTLGQNYLNYMSNQQQNMYGQLSGLAGMGATAAGAMGNLATGNAATMGNLFQQKGQIRAGQAALPWQTAAQANYQMQSGVADDMDTGANMFGQIFGGMGGAAMGAM